MNALYVATAFEKLKKYLSEKFAKDLSNISLEYVETYVDRGFLSCGHYKNNIVYIENIEHLKTYLKNENLKIEEFIYLIIGHELSHHI